MSRKTLTVPISLQASPDAATKPDTEAVSSASSLTPEAISDKISYAFQLATAQGPLCHEPVQGTAVFLEDVTVTPPSDEDTSTHDNLGRLTGEVIKTVRDSIRQGFLDWSPRLLLAMYSCEIQASGEYPSELAC
jgi:ribosome assembly protein 1